MGPPVSTLAGQTINILEFLYNLNFIKINYFILSNIELKFDLLFFEINKHADDFKINPSLSTLKLLSFKVLPDEVISVIISAEPINGYVSVAPRLGIILY